MNAAELAKKPPMAAPGFTVLTPKTETAYDKKIQAEQEKQMADCCGGYSRYDHYGYKPHPQNPPQDSTPPAEPAAAPQSVPPPEKKNSKRQ
jgi:hypothetical protein